MKQYDNYVIVVGNEKGGAGKTTSTMHLIASLMELGFKVGSIDVDCRQLSLSRYLENRLQTSLKKEISLAIPDHYIVKASNLSNISDIEQEETNNFMEAFLQAKQSNDFIIIDTPGSNSFLSRLAHSYADCIITPINDSFIDLDVIAKVEAETLRIEKPALYSQMVWEQKMKRAKRDQGSINWIVMRNRLSNIDAKNKRSMAYVLDNLSQRLGFRVAPGFSERVIFRELFLSGLTLLDIKEDLSKKLGIVTNVSHLAAKQELREFLKSLCIQEIDDRLTKSNTTNATQIENRITA
jgi:chromosome partitioning protein